MGGLDPVYSVTALHTVLSILGSIPIANTIVGTGGSVSLLLGDKDIGMELVTQVSIIWL